MKVFLHLGPEGFYYAGRGHWTSEPRRALDLETIEEAAEVGHEADLENMELVVCTGDASCAFVLPLRRRQIIRSQAAPPGDQPPLHKAA
jgi:hypothetical protein